MYDPNRGDISGELLTGLMLLEAQRSANLVSNADPNDPVMIRLTKERLRREEEFWPAVKKGWALAEVGFILFWLFVLHEDITPGFILLSPFVAFGFSWMVASFGYAVSDGDLCQKSYGEMMTRQSSDIHAMRQQAIIDRDL